MTSNSDDAKATEVKVSKLFSATDSDVTFQSTDRVLFRIHRKNLETHTAGFPPPEFEVVEETVPLEEDSTTLELLFQFVYPMRHPDLESTGIDVLARLAEAAEKYEIFAAINICNIRMKGLLTKYPFEVLVYSARHGYRGLAREAAPLLLSSPLSLMVTKLPGNLIIPWVLYYERWRDVYDRAIRYLGFRVSEVSNRGERTIYGICGGCFRNFDSIVGRCALELSDIPIHSLLDLYTLGDGSECCSRAVADIQIWRRELRTQIEKIPGFDEFM